MSDPEPMIGLTVEVRSEPIAGSIRLPNGATERFEGYLQLIAALESARSAGPNPADDARSAAAGIERL